MQCGRDGAQKSSLARGDLLSGSRAVSPMFHPRGHWSRQDLLLGSEITRVFLALTMPFLFLLVFNIKPLERRDFYSIKRIKGEEISPLQWPDWFLSLVRAPLSIVLLGQSYLSDQISITWRYFFLVLGKPRSKAIRLHKYVFLSVANRFIRFLFRHIRVSMFRVGIS